VYWVAHAWSQSQSSHAQICRACGKVWSLNDVIWHVMEIHCYDACCSAHLYASSRSVIYLLSQWRGEEVGRWKKWKPTIMAQQWPLIVIGELVTWRFSLNNGVSVSLSALTLFLTAFCASRVSLLRLSKHIKYENLAAGLSGGVISTMVLHPLDLIKIRFAGM